MSCRCRRGARRWNEERQSVEWENDEAKQQQIGWSLVETYLRETPLLTDVAPDAVEVPVEADLSSRGLPRLVGVLDLVQAGVIVDFKTSATTPNPEQLSHVNEIQTSG